MFLNKLKLDFRYSSSELYTVLKTYSESRKNYINKCSDYIGIGYDFPEAFRVAVEEELLLKADEKEKLIDFGNSLGTSCVDTQIELISYYTELFSKKYCESCVLRDKNSKAAILIGTFAGLGIYIISV